MTKFMGGIDKSLILREKSDEGRLVKVSKG
jgi:hypothetical protein